MKFPQSPSTRVPYSPASIDWIDFQFNCIKLRFSIQYSWTPPGPGRVRFGNLLICFFILAKSIWVHLSSLRHLILPLFLSICMLYFHCAVDDSPRCHKNFLLSSASRMTVCFFPTNSSNNRIWFDLNRRFCLNWFDLLPHFSSFEPNHVEPSSQLKTWAKHVGQAVS